jgi:hypothetical protein
MRLIGRMVLAVGALILLFYMIFFATLAFQWLREPVVTADDEDVRYVAHWLYQRDEPVEILNSYHPPANWAGDFEKEFAIRIDSDGISRFLASPEAVRGDRIDGNLRRDVEFALVFAEKLAWFPTPEMIFSDKFHVAPVRTWDRQSGSDAVYLVLVEPAKEIAYYVEAKM